MCGLLLYLSNEDLSYRTFNEALALQQHRGPDNSAIFFNDKLVESFEQFSIKQLKDKKEKDEKKIFSNFFIGHNRLSLFDLSKKSNQPFFKKNSNDFFIYNGEFYNFKDYCNKNSDSDGLTLFENIQSDGIEFYNKVNGMWASVHSDLKNKKIYLSRDRYGKKPLYYFLDKDKFIISSEIKSIFHILKFKRHINLESLSLFFTTKQSPFSSNEQTFYKNIHSIKPGEIAYFDLNLNKLEHHSKIKHISDNLIKDFDNHEAIENAFKEDFESSVNLRLQSDRKVGVLLSGGVDSSLITSFIDKKDLSNYNFYTIFNSDSRSNDDLFYSKKISTFLDINLNSIPIHYNYHNFSKILKKISIHLEIPVNFHSTIFPTYYISEQMQKDNINISLDGVGGDEIMGGYPKYINLSIGSLRKKQFIDFIKYYMNYYKNDNNGIYQKLKVLLYIIIKGFVNPKYMTSLARDINFFISCINNLSIKISMKNYLKDEFEKKFNDHLSLQIEYIESGVLPFYLGVSDSLNMMHSVENRSPFLDTRLYKYINMPNNLKFKKGFNKFLLRKVLSEKFTPEIAWRKKKVGFSNFGGDKFLREKKSIDKIFDSRIVREITKTDLSKTDLVSNTLLMRSLLSLATLDDIYKLSI